MTKPKVIADIDSLMAEITALCPSRNGIVSIDGFCGSGKTTLVGQLCPKLSAVHIEVDRFLDRNKGTYVGFLRYGELKRELTEALTQNVPVLVEGVCLRQILERISVQDSMSIYVKRVGAGGWSDGSAVQLYSSAEEAIAREEASLLEFAKLLDEPPTQLPASQRELIEYHFAFKPHERAQVIFINQFH